MDPALWELLRETSAGNEEVEAVVRLAPGTTALPGVRIISRFGPIATCRLSRNAVIDIRSLPEVTSLKAPRLLAPERSMSSVRDLTHAVRLTSDERRPPDLTPTGRGVVIGLVDFGLDFAVDALRNRDGTTRLLGMWDQRDTAPDRGAAFPYGYGAIHSQAAINAALRSRDPYAMLGYHPSSADPSGLYGAHATHVADIAAGNGRSGGPSGIAPAASLVFVHAATKGTAGLANLGDSTRVIEAVDFCRRVARDRPLVLCLSMGRHAGPHDGSTMAEQCLEEFVGRGRLPGRAAVLSVGNYQQAAAHASGTLQPGATRTLRLRIDPADSSTNEIEAWHNAEGIAARLQAPDGALSDWVGVGQGAEVRSGGRVLARLYHRRNEPNSQSHVLNAFVYPGSWEGEWRLDLRLHPAAPRDALFHAFVERDDACAHCQSRFHPDDVDPTCTTGTLANGIEPITCGAFDGHSPDRSIAGFSSQGPTRAAPGRPPRPKPDLVAPGVAVLAARSTPFGAPPGSAGLIRKTGTSMASPHVAGCAALLLEVADGRLCNADLRELILSTAEPAAASPEHAQRLGSGYLDISRAVQAAARPRSTVVQIPKEGTIMKTDIDGLVRLGELLLRMQPQDGTMSIESAAARGFAVRPETARQALDMLEDNLYQRIVEEIFRFGLLRGDRSRDNRIIARLDEYKRSRPGLAWPLGGRRLVQLLDELGVDRPGDAYGQRARLEGAITETRDMFDRVVAALRDRGRTIVRSVRSRDGNALYAAAERAGSGDANALLEVFFHLSVAWQGFAASVRGTQSSVQATQLWPFRDLIPVTVGGGVEGMLFWIASRRGLFVQSQSTQESMPTERLTEVAGDFERAIPIILKAEGGYVNNPNDPGGETNFGISKRSYPDVDIKNLTVDQASAIYRSDYWIAARCEDLPWPLSLVHFDCAVNQGVARAARLLQHSVGVTEDGVIGPQTIAAAAAQPQAAVRYLFHRLQSYCEIVKAKPTSLEFLRAWVLRMVHLSRQVV